METLKRNIKVAYNAAAYWTLPRGIDRLLRKIFNEYKSGKDSGHDDVSKLVGLNSNFKDRHKGERCFILATGPSVGEQDLTPLKNELCIAVSHFFLHKDIEVISPQYHVLAPHHPPFTFDDLKKIFCGFKRAYPENKIFFFGHTNFVYSTRNFLIKFPNFSPKNVFYINYTNSQQLNEDNYRDSKIWDISKIPFCPRTVVFSAIQLAFYMGCKEIYLIGCDHDYLLDMKRVTNHHFYQEEKGTSDIQHLSEFTSEKWFEEYYYRWKQYRLMRNYLSDIGCSVYNATEGGMLDVFQRVRLNTLLTIDRSNTGMLK